MLNPTDFVAVHLKKLEQYVDGITGGTLISNKYERLAVERFISHRKIYIYKEQEIIKSLRFFSLLSIQIGNNAIQCEIMDFQMMWLASIIGIYKTESQTLYSQSFILVSKKNNKSGFAAILSLYFNIARGTLNAHSLLVGASRDQAKLLINAITFILKNSPAIENLFRINKNIIFNENNKSVNRIEIRSSEAGKINGVNPNFNCVDEFAYHANSELQQSLKSAQILQKNHHQLIISTTSNNQTNPAFDLYESAKNILEGLTVNDDLFTVIYTLDKKEEYFNPINYRKANPALGHTVTVDGLTNEVNSAIAFPFKLETVLNHHFNVWHNQDQESFICDERIVEQLENDLQIPTGSSVTIGADFSSLNDLSALVVLFNDKLTDRYIAKTYHIFPNSNKNVIKNGSVDLRRWIDEGEIIRCSTESLDENLIIDLLKDISLKYKITNFGFDSWNSRILANRIENEIGINCIPVAQNYTLSYPIKFVEKLLSEKRLFFNNSPVTRWQFRNLRIKSDSKGNYHINKHNRESVDGVVALAVAMSVHQSNEYSTFGNALKVFEF